MSDTTTAAQAAEAKAATAKYVKCPKCAAALAARKLMMGCDVCGGTGGVPSKYSHASRELAAYHADIYKAKRNARVAKKGGLR